VICVYQDVEDSLWQELVGPQTDRAASWPAGPLGRGDRSISVQAGLDWTSGRWPALLLPARWCSHQNTEVQCSVVQYWRTGWLHHSSDKFFYICSGLMSSHAGHCSNHTALVTCEGVRMRARRTICFNNSAAF
jgi:hypothetical protein